MPLLPHESQSRGLLLLRNRLRNGLALIRCFSAVCRFREKGLRLSFGHSSVMDLGRQGEHMAAPPVSGGLLLWRRMGLVPNACVSQPRNFLAGVLKTLGVDPTGEMSIPFLHILMEVRLTESFVYLGFEPSKLPPLILSSPHPT